MFAAIRICRLLTGQKLVPQHFSIAHDRSGNTAEMSRFVGTKVQFGSDRDEFALNIEARAAGDRRGKKISGASPRDSFVLRNNFAGPLSIAAA
jgi:hypothetical protein